MAMQQRNRGRRMSQIARPKADDTQELDSESRQVIRQMLEEYDEDKNGVLDSWELGRVLRSVGIFPTENDISFFMKVFDKNRDGLLQIEELLDNWGTVMRHSVSGPQLMDAFLKIDKDRDGYIRLPELMKVLTSSGREPMSGEEASQVLEELMKFDKDFDGKFSYGEFVHMFMDYKMDWDNDLLADPEPEVPPPRKKSSSRRAKSASGTKEKKKKKLKKSQTVDGEMGLPRVPEEDKGVPEAEAGAQGGSTNGVKPKQEVTTMNDPIAVIAQKMERSNWGE